MRLNWKNELRLRVNYLYFSCAFYTLRNEACTVRAFFVVNCFRPSVCSFVRACLFAGEKKSRPSCIESLPVFRKQAIGGLFRPSSFSYAPGISRSQLASEAKAMNGEVQYDARQARRLGACERAGRRTWRVSALARVAAAARFSAGP